MIRLETLGDGSSTDRNFQRLMSLVLDSGENIGLRFGSATITWPGGSPRANNTSVSHGLTRTPVAVVALAGSGVAGSTTVFPVLAVRAGTLSDTTLELTAVTSDESSPAAASTVSCYWIALG